MLSKNQIYTLSQALDRQYAALLEEVRSEVEHSENQQYIELIGRMPVDSADAAVGDVLADFNLGTIDRHVGEIRDIEAARARIKAGTFGTCIDCGGDIGFQRLGAHPVAKRCLACQATREKTYAHAPMPKL